jgi:hypothetical protein
MKIILLCLHLLLFCFHLFTVLDVQGFDLLAMLPDLLLALL